MKKKALFPIIVCVGIMGYSSSKELFIKNTTDSFLLTNVEALAVTETETSWNCDGTKKNECCLRCGVCNTHVHGTGKTKGTHSCK